MQLVQRFLKPTLRMATAMRTAVISVVFRLLARTGLLALFAMLMSKSAFASNMGGGGMPWETPLQNLETSLTGPVAIGISLIAIVVSGVTLIFGGEMNEFGRRMIMVVLVIAVIVFAGQVLTSVIGAGSVVIASAVATGSAPVLFG